ncbi:MAG: DUF4157 domain-containing protein [Bacteroidota bacterium]
MNTHIRKSLENDNHSLAKNIVQQKNNSVFQFVDNRPEAVAQRKFHECVNNSSQVKQAMNFGEMVNGGGEIKQHSQVQSIPEAYSSEYQQPIQQKKNNTGLPDNLKSGIEKLSGYSMDDVKVHRNSDKPAQLQAHAYTQGTDIHVASGQEKHLPHEAWHVVQQKQGRVKPTIQMKDKLNINDDAGLEKEADVMGKEAIQMKSNKSTEKLTISSRPQIQVLQRVVDLNNATTRTEHGHYFIKTDNPYVLYSLRDGVAGPRPTSLYKQENEESTNGLHLFKWIPNIRLFSNDERESIEDGMNGFGEIEGGKDTSALMAGLDTGVKNPPVDNDPVQMPTKGILGKNDCGGLARTLKAAIGDEGIDNTGDPEEMRVGDQMTHRFPQGATCEHHSATVVAEDLPSLVTLEAHVGKSLQHPEFHIRNGVQGFVEANQAGQPVPLGEEVAIARAAGRGAAAADMEALRGVYGRYAAHNRAYGVGEHPGITDLAPADERNDLLERRRNTLTRISYITNKYWGKYTSWAFKPKGVKSIKAIVSGVNHTPVAVAMALTKAKVQASSDVERETANRHSATRDFYHAVSRMNINDMESLQMLIDNINHISAQMDAKRVKDYTSPENLEN